MNHVNVMTVDDSAAILTIIAAYLEDSEFDVVASERDGRRAVQKFQEIRPDIVLLDLGAGNSELRDDPMVWSKVAVLGPWLVLPGLWSAIFSSAMASRSCPSR